MALSTGYDQLQPDFILGTDQWVSSVAEQMVGADIDKVNQLRDHFPFFPIVHGTSIIVPRVAGLGGASFSNRQSPKTNDTITKLANPAEEVRMTSIEGSVNLADYSIDLQSQSIDQLDLQLEFKKIAIRITFWEQFFSPKSANGFKGLPDLVAPNQILPINRILSLHDLDLLVSRVIEADAEMDRKIVVMNSSMFVHFTQLVRATGTSLTYTMFNGRRYASHNGVPILISDFISEQSIQGRTGTDIWCMTLGIEDNGVFGVVPEDVGESGLVIEQSQGTKDTSSLIYRLRWYSTVILGHFRGLAGISNAQVSEGTLIL